MMLRPSGVKFKFHGSSCLAAPSRLPRSACHAFTSFVGRRSAAVYGAACLSVCRVVLQSPRARRPCGHARSSRGCHEDATRKLLPWNFSLTKRADVREHPPTPVHEMILQLMTTAASLTKVFRIIHQYIATNVCYFDCQLI